MNCCVGHFFLRPTWQLLDAGIRHFFPGFSSNHFEKFEAEPEKLQDPTPNISQYLTEQISLVAVGCSCTFGWQAEAIVNNGG